MGKKSDITNWFKVTADNAAIAFGLMNATGKNGDRFVEDASTLNAKLKKFCGMDSGILASLARKARPEKDRHKPATTHEIVIAACAIRYGYAVNSFRTYASASEAGARRRVDRTKTKFFEDLRAFGRARFTATNAPIKASLGTGPTRDEYLDATPPGKRS